MLFQFGILGSGLFIAWFVYFTRAFLSSIKIRFNDIISILILLIGSIGPWMALDLIFFDELFLIPIYVFCGIIYLNKNDNALA